MSAVASTVEKPDYFLLEEEYCGGQPFFYSTEDYPWVKDLEANWGIIREEMMDFISGKEKIDVKNLNPPYLSSPGAWKNIYFYNFGWKKHENCKRFPKTLALLESIPNMIFGGVTVLEPHSKVLPHNGETNTTVRCHLGLKIPAAIPVCGIKVGDEVRGWEDGKVVMFSDAHFHSAWNDSDERRFVLVFDIVRDEYAHKKQLICANVLGALSLKYFYSLRPGIKELPHLIIRGAHLIITGFWYVYLPFQNRFKLP